MGRLNHHAIDNGDVKVPISEFPVELNLESVPYPNTTPIKAFDDDEMDNILEFFHSEHNEYFLDVDRQMIHYWLVFAYPYKLFTVSTALFRKDGGSNVSVSNCMSQFSMFFPTKATVKLANENTVHAQVVGII